MEKTVVVIDNGSNDGSEGYIRAHFPQVDLIASRSNLGFAAANNLGWEHVRRRYPRTEILCLLNQDTLVQGGWLRTLVNFLNLHPYVGAVQPKLRLHPETTRINTAGNRSHFLAFGFMMGYSEIDSGQYDEQRSIDFASGAALAVRTAPLRRIGLFDDTMFMYLEDAELSWKLRLIGYDVRVVPESVVYHKYTPGAPQRHYYHLERNRWLLLLTYFRIQTLLLLAPALLLMEAGQILFAAWHGLGRERLRVYGFFLRLSNLKRLAEKRRAAQRYRVIGDRDFMARFSGAIDTEFVRSRLLRFVANPLLGTYWRLVRHLIIW